MNTQTSDVDPQSEESSTTFPHPEHTHDDEQIEKSQANISANKMSILKGFTTCRDDFSYGLLPPFTQFRKQANISQQNQSEAKV
jgi:hypothetical protein